MPKHGGVLYIEPFSACTRIVQHRRQRLRRPRQQILANDDERDAGRAEVLLRAGVDQAVLARRRSAG